MATIGRYTVALVLMIVAYIGLTLTFRYFGFTVEADSATYWFGFLVGTANLAIWREVTA